MTGLRRSAALMRRSATGVAIALLLLGLAWIAGFAAFEHDVHQASEAPGHADGIVALTGGADRIDAALALLTEGRAPLLLISGVGHGADLAGLDHKVPLSSSQAARVTLGRLATSTRGNAQETASWVQANGIRSLIVVTAGYHMPRALLEIGRAVPRVTLYAVSVQTPALRHGMDMATIRVLANEYDKYLASWMHLTWRQRANLDFAGS